MEMLKVAIHFLLALGYASANPVLSVVPSTTFGVGTQSLVPGLQLGSSPSIVQILRQPGLVSQGITQLPLGLGGLGQLQQQQLLLNNGQVVTSSAGLLGSNVIRTNTGGLLGLNSGIANVNGVPVLLSGAGAGFGNGFVSSVVPGDTSLLQNPLLGQPLISVNPLVRQVAAEEVVETPASLVQVDPMDAALAEMENQGQIHMEKYAWGRSALNKATSTSGTSTGNFRSALLPYYPAVPGAVIGSGSTDFGNRPHSATRNPFVDANGKRKKHFEFYQYFRNLNPLSPQAVIPVAVSSSQPNSPSAEEE